MVATFDVKWDFGGSVGAPGTTAETITNLRFNNEDTNDQDTASPVTVVAATTVYSFWKNIYLKCSGAPATQVNNVKIYSDGSSGLGTGIAVKIGDENPVHNSGATTGYDVGLATNMTNHAIITASTSLFTYTSGSPRSVTISEAGSIINATSESTNYLVLQLELLDTASPGTTAQETITFSYDEI